MIKKSRNFKMQFSREQYNEDMSFSDKFTFTNDSKYL